MVHAVVVAPMPQAAFAALAAVGLLGVAGGEASPAPLVFQRPEPGTAGQFHHVGFAAGNSILGFGDLAGLTERQLAGQQRLAGRGARLETPGGGQCRFGLTVRHPRRVGQPRRRVRVPPVFVSATIHGPRRQQGPHPGAALLGASQHLHHRRAVRSSEHRRVGPIDRVAQQPACDQQFVYHCTSSHPRTTPNREVDRRPGPRGTSLLACPPVYRTCVRVSTDTLNFFHALEEFSTPPKSGVEVRASGPCCRCCGMTTDDVIGTGYQDLPGSGRLPPRLVLNGCGSRAPASGLGHVAPTEIRRPRGAAGSSETGMLPRQQPLTVEDAGEEAGHPDRDDDRRDHDGDDSGDHEGEATEGGEGQVAECDGADGRPSGEGRSTALVADNYE